MTSSTQHRIHFRRAPAPLALVALVASLAGCGSTHVQKEARDHFDTARVRAGGVTSQAPSLSDQAGPLVRGGAKALDEQARVQQLVPVARRAAAPFIGAGLTPVTSDDKLPSLFYEQYQLDFADIARGGRVPLSIAMARLTKLTGVAIRVQGDVFQATGRPGGNAPQRLAQLGQAGQGVGQPGTSMPMPTPLLTNAPGGAAPQALASAVAAATTTPADSVSTSEPLSLEGVEMKHQGTLLAYLNLVTDQLGLAWEWRDNTVLIMRLVNETHEVATTYGQSRYSMSSSGRGTGAGGAGGASNSAAASLEISEKGEADPLESIVKVITAMVAEVPGSKVTRSDGSGRIAVTTSREMQSRIREYVAVENRSLRQQVAVQLDIYSVSTDATREAGINWQALIAKAGEAARISISTPASLVTAPGGTTSVTVLPNIQGNPLSEILANSSLILQALNAQGESAQHRPVSLITTNRKWARVSRMATETYLSETTPGPASSTGVGAPGLKTSEITTGDQYAAMPIVLQDNTVLLKFGISLSDLLGLFDVTVGQGVTQQKVQAPKVNAANGQFEVLVRPGEVVAVTGLSRLVSSNDKRRLFEGGPIGTGGSDKTALKREHFIIFVRPVLL